MPKLITSAEPPLSHTNGHRFWALGHEHLWWSFSLSQDCRLAELSLIREGPSPPVPWSSSCSKFPSCLRVSSHRGGNQNLERKWLTSDHTACSLQGLSLWQALWPSIQRFHDLVLHQIKQGNRLSERVMAPNPLSLVLQKLSPSYADGPIFGAWINLAALVKEGHVHFVILCLLTVLGASCVFPFTFHSILAAVRASRPFLHSPSHCVNQQGVFFWTQRTLRFLGTDQPSGNPLLPACSSRQIAFPVRSAISSCLLSLCAHTRSPRRHPETCLLPTLATPELLSARSDTLSACHAPPSSDTNSEA